MAAAEPSETTAPAPTVEPAASVEPVERTASALEEVQRISPPGSPHGLGTHFAFTGDRLLVPDWQAEGERGTVVLYERSDGELREVARYLGEERQEGVFSVRSVAMAGDVLLACDEGMMEDDRSTLRWLERRGDRLVTAASLTGGQAMCSGLVTDGARVVVGARRAREGRGELWEVRREDDVLSIVRRFGPPAGVEPHDGYGARALALAGGRLAAGADGAFGNGSEGGAIFLEPGAAGEEVIRYQAPELLFGSSVALDGSILAATADMGSRTRVAVYERRGGAWTRGQTIEGPGNPANEVFGDTIALGSGLLAIGDPGSGAAHVYVRRVGRFERFASLDIPGEGVGRVGLAIAGDYVAIGFPDGGQGGTRPGAIAIYRVRP